MSDSARTGVVYTHYSRLSAGTPIASLWSFETRLRDPNRRSIMPQPDGSHEYWLEQSDPLLNTMLPGTHVSLIVNFSDPWAAGKSLDNSALLPRVCVAGAFTQSRMLSVGPAALAIGAVIPPTLSSATFGVPATELVNRFVSLEDLWGRPAVERLLAALSSSELRRTTTTLRDAMVTRMGRWEPPSALAQRAAELIRHTGGRITIDELARSHGVSRQLFARRFAESAGLAPKLYARITRFQSLVRALLSNDVSRWSGVSTSAGYYDQAHMINEFREFAGMAPTMFFRPFGEDPDTIQVRGRPSEWRRRNPR